VRDSTKLTPSKPPTMIRGLHHELSSTDTTTRFVFLWMQQRCNHPLWYPIIGTAQTILFQRVRTHFVMTGLAIVTVGPCGLTHHTEGQSKIGLLKQKLKAKRDARWYYWFPPELTLPGGTSIVLRTKSNSLEVASSLGTSLIRLPSHRQLW
jgi:hypothetical protein